MPNNFLSFCFNTLVDIYVRVPIILLTTFLLKRAIRAIILMLKSVVGLVKTTANNRVSIINLYPGRSM